MYMPIQDNNDTTPLTKEGLKYFKKCGAMPIVHGIVSEYSHQEQKD